MPTYRIPVRIMCAAEIQVVAPNPEAAQVHATRADYSCRITGQDPWPRGRVVAEAHVLSSSPIGPAQEVHESELSP